MSYCAGCAAMERRLKFISEHFDQYTVIHHNCESEADLWRQVDEAAQSGHEISSRSQLRRVAAMKGEPAPEFGPSPVHAVRTICGCMQVGGCARCRP